MLSDCAKESRSGTSSMCNKSHSVKNILRLFVHVWVIQFFEYVMFSVKSLHQLLLLGPRKTEAHVSNKSNRIIFFGVSFLCLTFMNALKIGLPTDLYTDETDQRSIITKMVLSNRCNSTYNLWTNLSRKLVRHLQKGIIHAWISGDM